MSTTRASFFVSVDEILRHRSTGLKWVDIASLLGVTPKTLRLWRINNNYEVDFILYNDVRLIGNNLTLLYIILIIIIIIVNNNYQVKLKLKMSI